MSRHEETMKLFPDIKTETTRRAFIGCATAMAAWPGVAFANGRAVSTKPPTAAKKSASRKHSAKVDANPFAAWETPDGKATDSVMVRRLYLDLAGRIPTKDEAQEYVFDTNPEKRRLLVERLIASDDFADYWAMRFCDALRVKSEFPINLWPNAVYVYHDRVRRFLKHNEPWDTFGRAHLTSQGSDFRDAEANFFRATDKRTPEGWAEATAQVFLGIPPADLDDATRRRFADFLANVKIKNTREWKEEIVYVEGKDRRGELCDLLFGERRADVADAFVRRIRGWFYGADNAKPPKKAVKPLFRVKDVIRGIVLSDEYALGSVTGGFPVRRLDAEVLDDIFCTLSGSVRNYQSPAPEPFSFLPPKRKTVSIEDGSISNGFLTLFGRPARDTGLDNERGEDVTAKQRLYLFNSGKLNKQINNMILPGGRKIDGKLNPLLSLKFPQRIEEIYWRIVSRAPTQREFAILAANRKTRNGGQTFFVYRDLIWCLINTKEFLFRI